MFTKTTRFLSIIMALTMVFVMSSPVLASEYPDCRTQDDDENVIELDISSFEVLDEDELSCYMQETSSESSPTRSIYWLNTAGFSTTDVSLPFYVSAATQVTVIVLLKYMDGSTGTVSGSYWYYSGTLNVDGVTRTIGRNVYIPSGNHQFNITGVSSNMFYSVVIYSP